MAFQIVEIALDDSDEPISRKVVPYPFGEREEAVAAIKSIITKYKSHGYEHEHDYWWARGANGEYMRFIVETI
jgi:hypothetical protein